MGAAGNGGRQVLRFGSLSGYNSKSHAVIGRLVSGTRLWITTPRTERVA